MRSTTARVLAAAALFAGVPTGTAAAQSCIGFPLRPNQKLLASTIDERGEFGGIGITGSVVTRTNLSVAAQVTKHEVMISSDESLFMYQYAATASRPVFRNTWGAHKSGLGGTCALAELGGSSFEGASSNFIGGGLGYGLLVNRFAVYGAPVLGVAFAQDVSDSYLNIRLGGSVRLGPVVLGFETTAPLAPDGAQGWSTVRFGYAFGKATPVPATPARTASGGSAIAQQAVAQSGAAPAASGPTAGLKPYGLEDIEAMIKNSVATARIVELSRRACVSFRVDDAAETRLRRVGAEPELLTGLRQACYSAS